MKEKDRTRPGKRPEQEHGKGTGTRGHTRWVNLAKNWGKKGVADCKKREQTVDLKFTVGKCLPAARGRGVRYGMGKKFKTKRSERRDLPYAGPTYGGVEKNPSPCFI